MSSREEQVQRVSRLAIWGALREATRYAEVDAVTFRMLPIYTDARSAVSSKFSKPLGL